MIEPGEIRMKLQSKLPIFNLVLAHDGEDGMKKDWREYFKEYLCGQERKSVAVNLCGFDDTRRGNYFGGVVYVV